MFKFNNKIFSSLFINIMTLNINNINSINSDKIKYEIFIKFAKYVNNINNISISLDIFKARLFQVHLLLITFPYYCFFYTVFHLIHTYYYHISYTTLMCIVYVLRTVCNLNIIYQNKFRFNSIMIFNIQHNYINKLYRIYLSKYSDTIITHNIKSIQILCDCDCTFVLFEIVEEN